MLCVGPTGTGKSLYAKQVLAALEADQNAARPWVPFTMGFSAQTSANETQALLEGRLEKRRKGVYGPPRGKRYCILLDDLNMPRKA